MLIQDKGTTGSNSVQYCTLPGDRAGGYSTLIVWDDIQPYRERGYSTLIVKDDIQQGLVNFNAAVIVDITHLAEPVHEEAHPGASGADDARKSLLADFGNHRVRPAFFPKVG